MDPKGNEEFIEETEFYDRYEGGLVEASDAVPIDVRPERHLVFPALLNAYGEITEKVAVQGDTTGGLGPGLG